MLLAEPSTCFICKEAATADSFGTFQAEYRFSCQVCGAYRISNLLAMSRFGMEEERIPYLKAATRQASESGNYLLLTPENLESLAEQHRRVSFSQKIERFLRFVASKCEHPGAVFPADFNTIYPLFDCVNSVELFQYVLHLQRKGFLGRDDKAVWPTVEGWQFLEPTLRAGGEPDRCFVAMWFDDDLDSAYNSGFVRAIEDCGFKPYRVKEDPTNKGITDRILSEIRRAHFIVADFTGQRQSVYYEAGFAHGIGREVIACCQEGHITSLAFDTRHLGHVVWKDATDLRNKLSDSIRANIIPKR